MTLQADIDAMTLSQARQIVAGFTDRQRAAVDLLRWHEGRKRAIATLEWLRDEVERRHEGLVDEAIRG